MFLCVLFYLGQLSHFLSCFGAGVTNLNKPPSSFLLPPHYCGLGAGSIPFRAIANNKQCEIRGLFMSLVIHYWIADVQDCQDVSTSEMTYIVSSGALNSTHSLTHWHLFFVENVVFFMSSILCLWMMWYVVSLILDVAGMKVCLHIVQRHCLNF